MKSISLRKGRYAPNRLRPAVLLAILLAFPGSAAAQDTAVFFRQNCVSCHTIGGGALTGPDLKDVTKRKDRTWLTTFMQDPQAVINGGDSYALKLKNEAKGVVMPKVMGMNPDMAAALLKLIEAESNLKKSQFTGLQIPTAPFTRAQIAAGKKYFTGGLRLGNGGPTCISCHTAGGIGIMGGGKIGPDLNRVYERLQGRSGLAAWLSAPATVTMQSVFKTRTLSNDEILALTAYFEDRAKRNVRVSTTGQVIFLICGLGSAVFCLFMFDSIWKYRFQGVRSSLVHGEQTRGGGAR